MHEDHRLAHVISAIDAANARDPNRTACDGQLEPAELVYGWRMSARLERIANDASAHLRIATRGQHIERWTCPRSSYPQGRAGYLAWRKHLQQFHARRLAEIMSQAGYGAADSERVRALVCKERLKSDAEAQLLEDVACLVFIEHYLIDFMQRTEKKKLAGILAKTWRKMSPLAREQALKLDCPAPLATLVRRSLPPSGRASSAP